MTAIQSALTEISAVVAAVSGIRQAPAYPNETQNVYPFAVTYLQSANIHAGPVGTKRDLLNIKIDVCLDRNTDINRAMSTLAGLVDTISAALVAEVSGTGQRFNKTISTFDTLRIDYLSQDYAGVPCMGYSFVMENVKILIAL